MKSEIITMGSINQDVFVNINDFPEYGETLWANSISSQPGGKGANQAITLAKLSNNVTFISAIGNDNYGEKVLEFIKLSGVEIQNITIKEEIGTGLFIVILDKNGENTMIGTLGANNHLSVKDVKKGFKNTKATYFLLQLETSISSIKTALQICDKKGIKVVLDPAPVDGIKEDFIQYADIITPNQKEAQVISGIKVKDTCSAKKAAKIIHEKGANTVILKLGNKGSLIYDNNNFTFVDAYNVKTINTVGAGDVFVAALTSYISSENNIVESVMYATAAAAIKVSKLETQKSIPTHDEIVEFRNNYNLKNKNGPSF
ncbi:PfkB family carbohydrate kinase [Staphylococcus cohnii]|uniref:PfkB family carbohydrate kinase n=1 Tax=Staphylococcus cohnii TaxID=29382 RepID=UPI003D7CFB5B